MRTVRIRLLPVAILALGLIGLVAPAASASSSTADRMLAAGAGSDFTSAVGPGSSYQALACWGDPADDVVNLEDDGESIDEPRADIVEHCADFSLETLSLYVEMAEATDPEADGEVNWSGSTVGWFIDLNGDDDGEFFAEFSLSDAGTAEVSVQDRDATPAAEVDCADASFEYADGTISVHVPAECIGSPDSAAVSPGVIYDQRVGSPNGHAVFDKAPNGADFEAPVGSGPAFEAGVTRTGDSERIGTAIAISQAGWPDTSSADTVVLARSTEFPDALTGTPLAIELDAPILLSETAAINAATVAEMNRILPTEGGTVVLLGGELALSAEVQAAVEAEGHDTVRYGGTNRFETAVEIAEALGNPDELLIADGGTFQDAILAGPAAASVDGAVLLTDGTTVPPATEAYVDTATDSVTTIGDTASEAMPGTDSVGSGDPVETSLDVAAAYFPDADLVGIARDDIFSDSLTGGAAVGNPRVGPGPVLFVQTDNLPDSVEDYLIDNDIDAAVIFGGNLAVSDEVAAEIAAAIS